MAARVRSVKCLGKLEKPRPRKVSVVTESNAVEEKSVDLRNENRKPGQDQNGNTKICTEESKNRDENVYTRAAKEDAKMIAAKHSRSIRCRGKLEKPRPRRVLAQPDVIPTSQPADEVSRTLQAICQKLDSGNILALYQLLCWHGRQLEAGAPDILNNAYDTVRSLFCGENDTKNIALTPQARACLLQIIELRASKWNLSPCVELYYKQKQNGCALSSENIKNNQSLLHHLSSPGTLADTPDILNMQPEILKDSDTHQHNAKPVPVPRTVQEFICEESESGLHGSSPDDVETTNELYRSIIMSKMSSVDEHDHRSDGQIELGSGGEELSNGLSGGDPAVRETGEHRGKNVRRELSNTEIKRLDNAIRNEKKNRTVFSIDKWDAQNTIDGSTWLFDIRGATKDRNKAIRLIAERCDIVKNPDKYWHEMYTEETTGSSVHRRSSTPSKESGVSFKTTDSESHVSTTNPQRVISPSVSLASEGSVSSVSRVMPKAEESKELNNNDCCSGSVSGWEQAPIAPIAPIAPVAPLSRLRRATTNVPISIQQTRVEDLPARSRSRSCGESLNVEHLTDTIRRVEVQDPLGWEGVNKTNPSSEDQNIVSGWEGGDGHIPNVNSPSQKITSEVEEDNVLDLNSSQQTDASGWEGGYNCDKEVQITEHSDKSGWTVTFTTVEDAYGWENSDDFTVHPKSVETDSGVEIAHATCQAEVGGEDSGGWTDEQDAVLQAEGGNGEAYGATCGSPSSSLDDVWDDNYEEELAKALAETNTEQRNSTSESWILPGHGWELPDMSRYPPSSYCVDMKRNRNNSDSSNTVDITKKLSGPSSIRKGFGTPGSEAHRRSSCSALSNSSDHELTSNPKVFKRNLSETYGPYGETAYQWGSTKAPVHGKLGYLQPSNILREPLHPMSSLWEINRAERGQPIGGHSAANRRKKFAEAAARRLTSLHPIKDRSDGRIQYTRDFLLACAVLPMSRHPPANWAHFVSEFPVVCIPEHQTKRYFDPLSREHLGEPEKVVLWLAQRPFSPNKNLFQQRTTQFSKHVQDNRHS